MNDSSNAQKTQPADTQNSVKPITFWYNRVLMRVFSLKKI